MKFEVNAKDHARYIDLQNEIKDVDRLKVDLEQQYI